MPTTSFVLVVRDRSALDAVWRTVDAQDAPKNEIDVHVIAPPLPRDVVAPELRGDVVVFLDGGVLPDATLTRRARERIAALDDPRAILQGRVLPDPERVTDLVSHRLVSNAWNEFSRINDPEDMPLRWIDPRCLCMHVALYEAAADLLLAYAKAPEPSTLALAAALRARLGVRLRYRPGLLVKDPNPVSIETAVARARHEGVEAGRLEARGLAPSSLLASPPRSKADAAVLPTADAQVPAEAKGAEASDRIERIVRTAHEIARIDRGRIVENASREIPVVPAIDEIADTVLRAALHESRLLGVEIGLATESALLEADASARVTAFRRHRVALAAAHERARRLSRPEPSAPSARRAGDPDLFRTRPAPSVASERPAGVDASILIVAENAARLLPGCLDGIARHTPAISREVIVVDNASCDETPRIARASETVSMVLPLTERLGHAEALNLAVRMSRGRHIILLEPDAVPAPGWIGALVAAAEPGVGAVGPVSNGLLGAQGLVGWIEDFTVVDDIERLTDTLAKRPVADSKDVGWIQPLAVLVPREAFVAVGAFDGRLETPRGVALDLALRLERAGLRSVVTPRAFVAREGGLDPAPDALARARDAGADDGSGIVRFERDARTLGETIAARGGDGPIDSRSVFGVDWSGLDLAPNAAARTPQANPRLSVVIPVFNQLDYTIACLDSLRTGSIADLEIIVVDNASTDDTRAYLEKRSDVTVLRNERNLGFGPAVNRGIALATGRDVIVLNNDVIVPHRMIERMLETMDRHPDYGIIGPVTNWAAPSQKIDVDYEELSDLEDFADARWAQTGSELRPEAIVLGLAMLIRRDVLDTVGGFDERFEIGNFEDSDLSLRARVAGFKLGVAEGLYIHHFGGRTFLGEGFDYDGLLAANHARFLAKWQGRDATPSVPGDGWEPRGATVEQPTVEQPTGVANGHGVGQQVTAQAPEAGAEPPAAGDIYLLANDRLENGRFDEALELFEWTAELMPEMVLAHVGRGLSLTRLNRLEEAAAALEHAVELEPAFSEGYNNLGVVYHVLGRHAEAQQALERGIALDPANDEARANLDAVMHAREATA